MTQKAWKDGLYWTYTGPPLQTGDPRCNKCGGTEFRWIGTCIRCYEKEIDRWEELKKQIATLQTSRDWMDTERGYTDSHMDGWKN